MISEIDFIAKVEAHPVLYNTNNKCKTKRAEDKRIQALWAQIALDCGLPSAVKAQELWQQLLAEYMEYLRHGGDFPAASKMQFVQMSLLQSTDTNGDSSSYSDLDEAELERILSADLCEESASTKHSRKESEEGANSKNVINNKVATETPIEQTSDATNSPGNFSNLSSLELIFLGYAKVLQKMPLPLQLQTKRKIADVMDEAEMELYAQK